MRLSRVAATVGIFGFYSCLFLPVLAVALVAFSEIPNLPLTAGLTFRWCLQMFRDARYLESFSNSALIASGAAAVALTLAAPASLAMVRYAIRHRILLLLLFTLPLLLTSLLLGVATMLFWGYFLNIPAGFTRAIIANAANAFGFVFIVVLIQMVLHDWRFESAASVCGASPRAVFWRITVPMVWPGLLGAGVAGFLVSFNELNIQLYHVGAMPTMPTIAWGMLRYGIKPELYAFSIAMMALIFLLLAVAALLVRFGKLEKGGKLV